MTRRSPMQIPGVLLAATAAVVFAGITAFPWQQAQGVDEPPVAPPPATSKVPSPPADPPAPHLNPSTPPTEGSVEKRTDGKQPPPTTNQPTGTGEPKQ